MFPPPAPILSVNPALYIGLNVSAADCPSEYPVNVSPLIFVWGEAVLLKLAIFA